jgi:hypothetical protein
MRAAQTPNTQQTDSDSVDQRIVGAPLQFLLRKESESNIAHTMGHCRRSHRPTAAASHPDQLMSCASASYAYMNMLSPSSMPS